MTVKEQIVEAARERFLHYGYGKTTMAEVASDCRMSPGNLYRYFPGKLDIAEEIARRDSLVLERRLRALVNQPSCSALVKLKNFLVELLEFTYRRVENDPRLAEMFWTIIRERPKMAEEVLAMEQGLMGQILSAGNACGELAVEDIPHTSAMISAATQRFRYPQLRNPAPLEQLKQELSGVFELMAFGMVAAATREASRIAS